MWAARTAFSLMPCGWRHGSRAFSMSTLLCKEADPLSALFEEMEKCDTSASAQVSGTASKVESDEALRVLKPLPPPPADARLRLEEARQRRLQRQLKDVGEELNVLLNEKNHAIAQESSKVYVPARTGRTFFSSAELIQEKAPQEFVEDERSAEELSKMPSLQHSGCSAVITMVGAVISPPLAVSVVFPGDSSESGCVEFTVRYEIPFAPASTFMTVTVRAVGATLSAFAQENVGVGDVVHVLGHLAPFSTPGKNNSLCAVYVLPAGGNISVVLSKNKN